MKYDSQFIFVAIFIISVIGVLIIANLNPTESKTETEWKNEYMSGCMNEGQAPYSYCICTYNYLRSRYGMTGLADIAMDYQETNKLPREMFEAIENCLE